MSFQLEERPQHQVVDGYASHREYPILKPPHTTNQALTRVRDRVQDRVQHDGLDLHSTKIMGTQDGSRICETLRLPRLYGDWYALG